MDFVFVKNIVDEIVSEYGTRDVFLIVEKANISIIYENWHLVSIGEFDRKTKTIFVNRNALAEAENAQHLEKQIIAHELGHFFAVDLNLEKREEEKFARVFSEKFLEIAQ